MSDEKDLDLDLDSIEDEEVRTKTKKSIDTRISNALSKRNEAQAERDKIAKEKEEVEKAREAAIKERDFFKNFSTVSSKFPNAAEYQDKIKEKVDLGYDLEDATISILAKEGKYNPSQPSEPPKPKDNPAGGSAATTPTGVVEKPLGEMTLDEKRQALIEAEKRGDISLS